MYNYSNLIKKNDRFFKDILFLSELDVVDIEVKVAILEMVSSFAWYNHTGRFSSVNIDQAINDIAQKLNKVTSSDISIYPYDVLFIATELYDTGGHTKLLENIAKFENDIGSNVTLFVTRQSISNLPKRITSKQNIFKKIICICTLPINQQIERLRKAIDSSVRVYNVQHPDDIIAPIALSLRQYHNTTYVNHTDHLFWVGAHFCDRILNIRPYAAKLTLERRNAEIPSIVIPIKVALVEHDMTRSEAKNLLGLTENNTVLLTISEFYKIFPEHEYNFLELVEEILTKYPYIHYYFVGITESDFIRVTNRKPPKNLYLLGRLEDISVYQYAADIYLEGMPMNSLTACIDSVYRGAYPILMWGPYHENMNLESEYYFKDIIRHSKNKGEYLSMLESALCSKGAPARAEKVAAINRNILYYNSNEFWKKEILSKLSQSDSNQISQEFDIDLRDLRASESRHSYWKQQNYNPKIQVLNKLKGFIKKSSIIRLYFRNIIFDIDIDIVRRIKTLGRLLLR